MKMRNTKGLSRSTRSAPVHEGRDLDPFGATEQSRRAAYTVAEAAVLLGLSRGSTYALVRAGAIPAKRIGGRWIVPKRRFHSWLDDQPVVGAV